MVDKEKVIGIIKSFEQVDLKMGGVSLAPEMYNATAEHIVKLFTTPNVVGQSKQYCDWCSSTEEVEVKICKKCRQGIDDHR